MTIAAPMSSRGPLQADRDQFAADVRYYLTLEPRQLPSRYLYDDLGSVLFEAICLLPWYPLKRAEMRLLQAHAHRILGDDITALVELGSGSGEKLSTLIAAGAPDAALTLHLIDVSAGALAEAGRRLAAFAHVRVCPHETTYEHGLEQFAAEARTPGRALALFLGSNIGNFDPPGREAFLRRVRGALRPGDGLLLGTDLVKPEPHLLLAYDDPLGVTAAFNRNLLVRINQELGGDFDLSAFAHHARWNPEQSRVEMHLLSTRTQRVQIPGAEMDFVMDEGTSIWTESSYKFEAPQVVPMLKPSGFRVDAQWLDPDGHFALTSAEAV